MDARSCCSARKPPPEAYPDPHRQRFVRELQEFIRFPSVSSDPEHAADMRGCAAWLAHHLRAIGLEGVRVWDTAGHLADRDRLVFGWRS